MALTLTLQAIAATVMELPIEWEADGVTGWTRCPGQQLHSNPSTKWDCRIRLDGAPTAFCPHTSCAGVIAEKNRLLRSEIGKAQRGQFGAWKPFRPSAEEILRQREQDRLQNLKDRAVQALGPIIAAHPFEPVDLWESSPYRLDGDAMDDWRLLLQLYKPSDVIWIGCELYESGSPEHARNFRTVEEWRRESDVPGRRICPNLFQPGVVSRSDKNIIATRFLVVESDPDPNDPGKGLQKNDFCSVLKWLQKTLRLRAVVDTGGKSLHGWFDYPPRAEFENLTKILEALKCDPALSKLSHPWRLPGAMRENGRMQCLAYLDLGESQ